MWPWSIPHFHRGHRAGDLFLPVFVLSDNTFLRITGEVSCPGTLWPQQFFAILSSHHVHTSILFTARNRNFLGLEHTHIPGKIEQAYRFQPAAMVCNTTYRYCFCMPLGLAIAWQQITMAQIFGFLGLLSIIYWMWVYYRMWANIWLLNWNTHIYWRTPSRGYFTDTFR